MKKGQCVAARLLLQDRRHNPSKHKGVTALHFAAAQEEGAEEAVLSLLRNMSQILSLDTEARTVTVAGGTTYSQLTRFLLEETELALPTAASLAHTTIAGSVATGS